MIEKNIVVPAVKTKSIFLAQGGENGPLWIHLYIGQCVVILGT